MARMTLPCGALVLILLATVNAVVEAMTVEANDAVTGKEEEQQECVPPDRIPVVAEENGLLVFSSSILTDTDTYARSNIFSDVQQIRAPGRTASCSQLLLLLIHDPACPYSNDLLQRVEEASKLMRLHWRRHFSALNAEGQFSPPLFAKLPVAKNEGALLRDYSITYIPTLLFVAVSSSSVNTTRVDKDDCAATEEEATSTGSPSGSSRPQQEARQQIDANQCRSTQILSGGSTLLLEYTGSLDTPHDIFRTVLHYYVRLVLSTGGMENESGTQGDYVHLKPRQYDHIRDVQEFIWRHAATLLPFAHLPQGMNRMAYSASTVGVSQQQLDQQVDYLHWLLEEEVHDSDDFVVAVQCRSKNDSQATSTPRTLYERFDQMSRALSNRRDRFFAVALDCHQDGGAGNQGEVEDGSLMIWRLPGDFFHRRSPPSVVTGDWRSTPYARWYHPDANVLMEFLTKTCTPSVMVLDRQATAPIAFALYRHVHFIMVVETRTLQLTTDAEKKQTRNAVLMFRRACRRHQRQSLSRREPLDLDMVCLIVPSTETRVLMSLGVELWESQNTNDPSPADQLPMLIITDRRQAGTRRYYLDDLGGVEDFIKRFWSGQLEPDVKSDPRGPRTNAAGVRILTADSLQHELFYQNQRQPRRHNTGDIQANAAVGQQHHAMIVFVSPTCGHCKRILVLWNRLAEFLSTIGWDKSLIKLYRMDVTTNELTFHNLTVRWLPDLYYVPPPPSTHPDGKGDTRSTMAWAEQRMVRYDWKDEMGDDATINDTTDILQWFLSVAHLTNNQLRELTAGLQQI